ncbi:MAG: MotA/TolQ/ExbB proton channel family protein [Verrucomicrobiales bacterium]|jgi:biopolymer transport protein ExbB/TolQ|nr:MotA/TolQ/ExbB proton channel family protein [Verrucomicrobiales bacterium]
MTTPTNDPEFISLLKRKNRWLRLMIVSAFMIGIPLLVGLGGTVIRMRRAFDTMGMSGSGDPEELAENISFALITTAGGYIVSAVFLLVFLLSLIFWLVTSSKAKNFRNSTQPQL